ncbi:MAG: hypothetical protein U5K31_12920 [Balneolaceae bacterium]|nr:hypothetical protein [Balneolaceae bacterium]
MLSNRFLSVCTAGILLFCLAQPVQAQDSTQTDTLLQSIQQQMNSQENDTQASGQSGQSGRSATATTNPDISVIGDFQTRYHSEGERNWDAYVNSMEINFSSVIDPYARAEFFPVLEGEGGDLHLHLEEAYLRTLSLPLNLQLKVGKFRQQFGRMNLTHRHALPVIDVPVAYESFMGEAMIDQGASLSWLIPNQSFYQELIVDVTRGPGNSPLFAYSEENDPKLTAHLKNFWSLTENATFELGFSGAVGDNEFGGRSRLGGVNLTYIWKPVRMNTYKSFEWQAEFFFSRLERPQPDNDLVVEPDLNENAWGMYTWIRYQLGRRWHLTGMYSYGENPQNPAMAEQAVSAYLGWYATEFQKLEIGPRISTENNFGDTAFSGLFRWVFVIGSHGAHEY